MIYGEEGCMDVSAKETSDYKQPIITFKMKRHLCASLVVTEFSNFLGSPDSFLPGLLV